MQESESVIEHYGTKGMKWGVRNDKGHEGQTVKAKKLPKLDQQFEKNARKTSTFFEIWNQAAKDFNENKISVINNKPAYRKAADAGIFWNDDHPLTKKYHKEAQDAFVDSVNKAANSLGTNASGTKRLGAHILDGDDDWSLVLEDIKHASTTIPLKVTKDSAGMITSITFSESLSQSGEMTHYGVKGMKWGRRKEDNAGPAQLELKQRTPGSRVKIKATKGGGQGPAQDALEAKRIRQTAKKSGPNALSNKELQALVTRLNLEKQYAQLTPTDQGVIKSGALFAKKLSGLGRATNEAVQYANSPAGKLIKSRLSGS